MADMKTDAVTANTTDLDEELVEVLIAISIISKRLAKKITAKTKTTEVVKCTVCGTDESKDAGHKVTSKNSRG